MAESKMQVFLVDDHPLVRECLASLIDQQSDMRVCGEADDATTAQKGILASQPDIAIVDISLKDNSGLELIKAVKKRLPAIGIIVLSAHDEKLYAERSVRAGARGYVMKSESTKHIMAAIRTVRAGKLCVSAQLATDLAERFLVSHAPAGGSPVDALSDRELEVFGLLGRGLETRKVADMLNLSIKTVQAYCARIKQKLCLSSGAELLREAVRWSEQTAEN